MIGDDPIVIACGIDGNYAPHLSVMLQSLRDNNPSERFIVYVLHDNIGQELRNLVDSGSPSFEIHWVGADDNPVLNFKEIPHITRATYLRLLMDDLLPIDVSRLIYLDVDLVVSGGIRELWTTDLKGKSCAAVIDPGVDAAAFAQRWQLAKNSEYFNAGVMLIDMNAIRRTGAFKKAIEALADPEGRCEFADQDALNVALWGDWVEIDPGWNFQRKFLYQDFEQWKKLTPSKLRPAIVHFTEAFKPWRSNEWHPCAWLYHRALLKTPFKRAVLSKGGISALALLKSWGRWQLKRPPMFNDPGRGAA